MRSLVCLLICAIACRAQRPEDQVLTVYRQLEKAVQSGDADHSFVGLWSREKTAEAEKMRAMMHPRPEAQYTAQKVFVQGEEAALLGQYSKEGFLSMRFVKEEGRWKIREFMFSDKAYPVESVYAMIPPPAGAFERAGAPWENVSAGLDKAAASKQGWQVRATYDESCLYIRIESSAPMPAPGTRAEKPPAGWPVMKIGVAGVGEFVLHADANIGDQATFGEDGRANSHSHYVAYWLMLERADRMVFQTWAGLQPDPLIRTGDHFLDVRIPMRTISAMSPAKIVIGDAQWPKSVLFSLEAQRYK